MVPENAHGNFQVLEPMYRWPQARERLGSLQLNSGCQPWLTCGLGIIDHSRWFVFVCLRARCFGDRLFSQRFCSSAQASIASQPLEAHGLRCKEAEPVQARGRETKAKKARKQAEPLSRCPSRTIVVMSSGRRTCRCDQQPGLNTQFKSKSFLTMY